MSHPELEQLTPTITAEITKEQLEQGLTSPVEAKVNDILINVDQIKQDAPHFEKFGIDWQGRADKLETAAKALRSAETLFTTAEKIIAAAVEVWRENRQPLYDWRDESVARLTYLQRTTDNENLRKSLEKISLGEGHPDAIQDGFETVELCEIHFDALTQNHLTRERLDEAKALVSRVSEAYPQVLSREEGDNSAKELRDRAFWYLDKLEKELKEIELPLVFFDNYTRRREYGSHYDRVRHQKNKQAKAAEQAE